MQFVNFSGDSTVNILTFLVTIFSLKFSKHTVFASVFIQIFALLHGITNAYTMTTLIGYYAYYGIHVYQSNKIATVSNAAK